MASVFAANHTCWQRTQRTDRLVKPSVDGATWWDVSQFVQLISIGESSRWELTGTVPGGSL